MDISNLFSLVRGIALFLFGMAFMGDGLEKLSGGSLKAVLYKLSGTLSKGTLLGTGVTCVIQSSSATSIMTIGFVNSGMITLYQAMGIVLGSILGTSITGWILCLSNLQGPNDLLSLLSTSTLISAAAIVGIALRLLFPQSRKFNVGNLFLGFTILMIGMETMSSAVSPLAESSAFIYIITNFTSPLLGVLVGVLAGGILQSASAAVGILQALSVTGAITFRLAFPMIMGISIGSSLPVLLSAIGASADGRRTSLVYLLDNIFGVLACTLLFYGGNMVLHFTFMQTPMTMFTIAALNSLFRFCTLVIVYPFTSAIQRLVCVLIPDAKADRDVEPDGLDERFLSSPALALIQCGRVMYALAENCKDAAIDAIYILSSYNEDVFNEVSNYERKLDHYEDRLGTYMMRLNTQELDPKQTKDVTRYLHTLSDLERISDYAMNIAQVAQETYSKQIMFSEEASADLEVLERAVSDVISKTVRAFIADDLQIAISVEPLVRLIGNLCEKIRFRHIQRLEKSTCTLDRSFIFNDLLTAYKRISDHCSNIAVAVMTLKLDSLDTHEYLTAMKHERYGAFSKMYQEYRGIYHL